MAEIKLRFDITFSRRFVTVVGAAAVMLCAVPELDSESVTLSTYYPAPSGVYTNMITTGNTFLARDAGSVGVGTSAPGVKLDVAGDARASASVAAGTSVTAGTSMTAGTTINAGGTITAGGAFYANNSDMYFTNTGHVHSGIGNTNGYAAIENASDWGVLMILGRSIGTGGPRMIGMWDRVTVNGQLETTDAFIERQGASGCTPPTTYTYSTANGGSVALCAGKYVTTISGFYSKYYAIPLDRGPNLVPAQSPIVEYMCCNCPPSGCSGM